MMTREDWERYRDITCCLGVGRVGRYWYVIDRQTWQQIGPAFFARWEAAEYAQHREQTTFCQSAV